VCPYRHLPLIPALGKATITHIFTSYFSEMHYNIFHLSVPQSYSLPFFVELINLQFICISSFLCETYMPIPSQYLWPFPCCMWFISLRHARHFIRFLLGGSTPIENTLYWVNITVKWRAGKKKLHWCSSVIVVQVWSLLSLMLWTCGFQDKRCFSKNWSGIAKNKKDELFCLQQGSVLRWLTLITRHQLKRYQ